MSQFFTPYRTDQDAGTDTALHETLTHATATAVQSTAIPAKRILVTTVQSIAIKFGSNPTAAATDYIMPANSKMFFNCKSGNKLSAFNLSAATNYLSILYIG